MHLRIGNSFFNRQNRLYQEDLVIQGGLLARGRCLGILCEVADLTSHLEPSEADAQTENFPTRHEPLGHSRIGIQEPPIEPGRSSVSVASRQILLSSAGPPHVQRIMLGTPSCGRQPVPHARFSWCQCVLDTGVERLPIPSE